MADFYAARDTTTTPLPRPSIAPPITDITLQPSGIALPTDLSSQLDEFTWAFAYQQHPGFENNEGGYGTLTWDLTKDGIDLDHADRFVDCTHSYHEGL